MRVRKISVVVIAAGTPQSDSCYSTALCVSEGRLGQLAIVPLSPQKGQEKNRHLQDTTLARGSDMRLAELL